MKRKLIFANAVMAVLLFSLSGCSEKKDTISVIHSRKSVRSYTAKKVSRALLTKLVRAGMAAPTAMNRQPWVFIAIDDRATLDRLARGLKYAQMLRRAPAAIAVCGNMKRALSGPMKAFWVQDCSAAAQNVLLAAEASGLGAVWTAGYPVKPLMAHISRVLGLPGHIVPLCVIPVGYPDGDFLPKNKWKKEKLHWQKW